jgi:stage II sporulation protein M
MRYKNWLVVAILLFLAGMMLGLITPDSFVSLLAKDIAALQDLSRTLAALPPLTTAILIFAKNASALLASFAFSPLLLLLPILALTTNGWLLGWVSATILQKNSVLLLLAGILPHGIIEIPAFVIGEAAALGFGSLVILSLFKKDVRSQVLPRFKTLVKYLLLALALLIPAAFIEAFVTPLLIKGA